MTTIEKIYNYDQAMKRMAELDFGFESMFVKSFSVQTKQEDNGTIFYEFEITE
jgi:hypothetical protein